MDGWFGMCRLYVFGGGMEWTYFRPAPQPVPATMPPPCFPFHEQEYFPPPCCWHPNCPWPSVHHCQGAFWRGARASVGAARVEGRRAHAVARSAVRETILELMCFVSFRFVSYVEIVWHSFANFAISCNEGYDPLIYRYTYILTPSAHHIPTKKSQDPTTPHFSLPSPDQPSHRQSRPSED